MDTEETKNRPQYVLFDPVAVGWDIGLEKAIENAKRMHIPLAVKSQGQAHGVISRFPNVNIIIIE